MLTASLNMQSQIANDKILLWPKGDPEAPLIKISETVEERGHEGNHDRRHTNISIPDMEAFRPEFPNGTGVIIFPGGGYSYIVIDKEGRDIARWFNSIGVTAFVLKYRLPNTIDGRLESEVPLRDAKRSIRIVRSKAKEWGLSPNHIGVIGFSAGGHLASTLGTNFDAGDPQDSSAVGMVSCRPDFLILGYPVISMEASITHAGSQERLLGQSPSPRLIRRFSNELHIRRDMPPIFLFSATDDTAVVPENSLRFFESARRANVPVEIHLFGKGGHGFGLNLTTRSGITWPSLAESWLLEQGMLTERKPRQ